MIQSHFQRANEHNLIKEHLLDQFEVAEHKIYFKLFFQNNSWKLKEQIILEPFFLFLLLTKYQN